MCHDWERHDRADPPRVSVTRIRQARISVV
jgi:hypothetical protein